MRWQMGLLLIAAPVAAQTEPNTETDIVPRLLVGGPGFPTGFSEEQYQQAVQTFVRIELGAGMH